MSDIACENKSILSLARDMRGDTKLALEKADGLARKIFAGLPEGAVTTNAKEPKDLTLEETLNETSATLKMLCDCLCFMNDRIGNFPGC